MIPWRKQASGELTCSVIPSEQMHLTIEAVLTEAGSPEELTSCASSAWSAVWSEHLETRGR